MLSPKCNLTRSVYRMPHPEDRTPPACYEYESRIYPNYTASPDAEVSIHIELTGENAWLGLRMVLQRVQGHDRRDAHRSAGRVVLRPGILLQERAGMVGLTSYPGSFVPQTPSNLFIHRISISHSFYSANLLQTS